MSLILFAHPFASCCQKALIALYENGTPFTFRMLDKSDPSTFAEFEALRERFRLSSATESSAGFRNRPSREERVMKLRSVFSACSARSSHWCCSCSNFALVTGSAAASAAAAHLRANCRRYCDRALIQTTGADAFSAVAPREQPACSTVRAPE